MKYDKAVRDKNYLAQGAGRVVYSYGEEYVLKVPRQRRDGGELTDFQNRMELYVWNSCPIDLQYLLCPVVDYWQYKGTLALVAQGLRVATKDERKLIKDRTRGKSSLELGVVRAVVEVLGGKRIDEAFLKGDLERFCETYGLVEREIMKNPVNMGLTREGDLKILDYGFQKQYLRSEGSDWDAVCGVQEL